jgi:hypothetical protein
MKPNGGVDTCMNFGPTDSMRKTTSKHQILYLRNLITDIHISVMKDYFIL